MRSKNEQKDFLEKADYQELRLLSKVEENPQVSQRQLSQRMGIALGLTNVMLRNLVQKGYIRATKAGLKSWFYNLTPDMRLFFFAGFATLLIGWVALVMSIGWSIRIINSGR